MLFKNRLLILGSSVTVALLWAVLFVNTAFAAASDNDPGGVGINDLIMPAALILAGLLVIGLIVFAINRRNAKSREG